MNESKPNPIMILEPRYTTTTTTTTERKEEEEQPQQRQLDPLIVISLMNQFKEIINKTISLDGTNQSKLNLSNQSNRLKNLVSIVQNQVKTLTAGDLSINDQEELLSKLEKRIQIERELLDFMSEALPKKKKTEKEEDTNEMNHPDPIQSNQVNQSHSSGIPETDPLIIDHQMSIDS